MTDWKGVLVGVFALALVTAPVHAASIGPVSGGGEPARETVTTGATTVEPTTDEVRVGSTAGRLADGAFFGAQTDGSNRTNGSSETSDVTASTGTSGDAPPDGASHGGGTIRVDRTLYRTPNDRENVTVETSVTLPSGTVEFEANIAASLLAYPDRVVSTTNVTYHPRTGLLTMNSSRGETTTGSFTYEVGVNKSERFLDSTVDTAETATWALVEDDQYDVAFTYRYFDAEPHVSRTTTVAGEGYATNRYAFLGPIDTYRRTANGQTFTLVVSKAADPERTPDGILASLAYASRLNVGDRDATVTAFVVSDPIRRGGRGGGDTFWVHESTTGPIVTHEYVHTRQAWIDRDHLVKVGNTVEWLTEAVADYYQGYVPWQAGNMTSAAFRSYVATDQHANEVLKDVDDDAAESKNYFKGRRVLAALDVRVRNRSGGRATLTDVLRSVNGIRGEKIDYVDLRAEVVNRTDAATGRWLDTYVTSQQVPDIPQNIEAAYNVTADDGSGNAPPVADAGANLTAPAETTVTLDGTGSTDPDGDGLAFTWRQVAGPAVGLNGAGTDSVAFATPNVSSTTRLRFELEVSDGAANDTDTVTVTVEPPNTGDGQHESGVPRRVFDAVAGSDATLERTDVIAMVRGYATTESIDGVSITRQDVLTLVRYYVVNS